MEIPERRFADVDGPVHYREWEGAEELTFVLVHGLGGAYLNWVPVAEGLGYLVRSRTWAVGSGGRGAGSGAARRARN